MLWALLSDVVPLYPLYALLFSDTGLGDAQISVLFAVWSGTAILTEVPSGALADRFSRRSALVAAGVLQGAGYLVWTAWPGFAAFAAGFVLWGIGGSLASGALEALLFDGLSAAGRAEDYARVRGRVRAAGLLAQVPAAVAASLLFATGGYPLVGWASVGTCLGAAVVAASLPEPRRGDRAEDRSPEELRYVAMLRAGVAEAVAHPPVRIAVLALAAVFGLDAFEEYLTLLARDWQVPTELVPLALLGVPLAGAAGAALGGRANRWPAVALAGALAAAAVLLLAADAHGRPAALVGLAGYYLLYQLVLVVTDTRLQNAVTGPARATVTSMAGMATEVMSFVVYACWAFGQVRAFAALVLLVALLLIGLRRVPRSPVGDMLET